MNEFPWAPQHEEKAEEVVPDSGDQSAPAPEEADVPVAKEPTPEEAPSKKSVPKARKAKR